MLAEVATMIKRLEGIKFAYGGIRDDDKRYALDKDTARDAAALLRELERILIEQDKVNVLRPATNDPFP